MKKRGDYERFGKEKERGLWKIWKKGDYEALLLPSNNIDNTFGACAPKIFNDLPQEVRTCGEYKVFLKKTKSFLFDKALARSFS